MAVRELQNFRKKYPQYKDIGDKELATKLATKYPDAYGGLPAKVGGKEPLKKAWTISTPEELVQQGMTPTMAGLTATGQQLSSPLWKFGNMFLAGLPEKALRKMGYTAPTADIKMATPTGGELDITGAANLAANIGGFVQGISMMGARAATAGIPLGGSLLARAGFGALRGATLFGTAAGLYTPPEEAFKDFRARGMRAAGAGTLGAITGGLGGIMNHFGKLLKTSALLKTGQEVRAGFKGLGNRLTKWFGEKIDKFQRANPGKRVDISKQLETFEKGLEDKMKFNSLLRASPRLRKAIETRGNLTLKETQDLVNQLKSTISETQLAGFKVRPSGGEINTFIDSIQKQKHINFPQMKFTDQAYGQMKTYSKSVETYMKYGKTVKGLKTMFGNPEQRKALQVILPGDTFEKVRQTVTAQMMTKQGMRLLDYVIRYGVMYKVAQNLTKNITFTGGGEDYRGE